MLLSFFFLVSIFSPDSAGSVFQVLQPDYLSRHPQRSDKNAVSAAEMSVWAMDRQIRGLICGNHLSRAKAWFYVVNSKRPESFYLSFFSLETKRDFSSRYFSTTALKDNEKHYRRQMPAALCHKSGLEKRTDVNQSSRWPKENSQWSATVNTHFIPFSSLKKIFAKTFKDLNQTNQIWVESQYYKLWFETKDCVLVCSVHLMTVIRWSSPQYTEPENNRASESIRMALLTSLSLSLEEHK